MSRPTGIRDAVPGADDIADIGNGADSPVVTVPSGSTPTPTDPDGVPVGAINLAKGAEARHRAGHERGRFQLHDDGLLAQHEHVFD